MVVKEFILDGTYADYDDRKEKWVSVGRRGFWLMTMASRGLYLFQGVPRESAEGYDLSDDRRLKVIGVDLI